MAFQQGLSGLNAASKGLDVVGNNIANSGTVGFKSAQAHFADVYASSMSLGASSQVGIGVSIPAIMQNFTQANISTTNNPLDIAINGGGFFRVQRGDIMAYTRNGQFHADKNGYIINDEKFQLMGYPATVDGTIIPTKPEPLHLDTGNIPPRPTGDKLAGDMVGIFNLDSRKEPPTIAFNPANPLSYTWSTTTAVFDTLGVAHNLTFFFVKTGPVAPATGDGTWDVHNTLDGDNAGVQQAGTLTFDSSGNLKTPVAPGILNLPNFPVTTGAATPIGTGLPNWKINFTGSSQFGGESSENTLKNGGYAQGALSGVSIGATGIVYGTYSNGQAKAMGQVVLTNFADNNGLLNVGNNLYQETDVSGQGMDGVPGVGARGLLQSMAVEESNVDLTVELVNMITLQRAYQANAQTIKTQDQVMQTLVNLR